MRPLIRKLRLELMWLIAPVEKETIDGALKNLEENDYPEEYDTAGYIRFFLGLRDEGYLGYTDE